MRPLRPTGPFSTIGTAAAWPTVPRASWDDGVARDASPERKREASRGPSTCADVRPRPGAEGRGRAWRLEQLTHDNAADMFARVRDGRLALDDVQVVRRADSGPSAPRLPRDPEVQVRVLARLLEDPGTLALQLVAAADHDEDV